MAGKRGEKGNGEVDYKKVLDNIREGVYITDRHRTITYWNKGAEEITGYKSEEVLGSSCRFNILTHIDEEGRHLCDDNCPITQTLKEEKVVDVEAYLHHKEGYRLPVHIRTSPIRSSSGAVIGACEVFSDISSRISIENKIRELKKLAMLDPLTNLANRRYIDQCLKWRLNEVSKAQMSVGVIFYDIDHFKHINDTYGHDLGDLVIKMVAKTLIKNSRGLDVVGRWGGEEFIEIIPNATDEHMHRIAERNRMLVENSELNLGGEDIKVTVSVGVTFVAQDDTESTLIKRVDGLMYASKQAGRNCITFD